MTKSIIDKAESKSGIVRKMCFQMHIQQEPDRDSVNAVLAMSRSLVEYMQELDKQLKAKGQ